MFTFIYTCSRYWKNKDIEMHFKKYVRKNDFLKTSQRNCVFQLWLMTEPSEVLADFASDSAVIKCQNIWFTWVSYNVVVFFPSFSLDNHLQKVARLWKHPWGRFVFDNLKKVSGRSFFPFSPATLQKLIWMATSCEVISCNL